MEEIVIYSTNCPRCRTLAQMLDHYHIPYVVNSDTDAMIKLGIETVPVLCVDNHFFEYDQAILWVTSHGKEEA